MLVRKINRFHFLNPIHRMVLLPKYYFSQDLETKFSDLEKEKILQVLNESDGTTLSRLVPLVSKFGFDDGIYEHMMRELVKNYRYGISKVKVKKITKWKDDNGHLKNLCDIEMIEGFSAKSTKKLFASILNGPTQVLEISNKIKGQILHPHLSDNLRQKCKSVLAVYVSVNSVCWTLMDKNNYEVIEWKYHNIDYPEGKRFQITDILNISWQITQELPTADIYVMKAEATSLRAGGSDPNNPKVLAVNLQKSQMIAMIVALINNRSNTISQEDSNETKEPGFENTFKHYVYFLRPTLPYRLYGTLVGNENVSTDQTIDTLLRETTKPSSNNSKVFVPETLQSMYRSQKDLQKDMLGHCLLLGLTFMDLCIYKNQESIRKLLSRQSK